MFNTSTEFKKLLNDRENGSTTIAINFIKILLFYLKSSNITIEDLNLALSKLRNEFSDMSIINYLIGEIQDNKEDLFNILDELLEDINNSDLKLLSKFNSNVDSTKKTFLTYSNSHSLKFILCNCKVSKIYVMESIPGSEGKILYNNFKECLKEKTLVFVKNDELNLNINDLFDYLIIGCDSFNDKIGIINKIGTTQLINKMKKNQIPVIVIASKFKFMNEVDFLNKIKKLNSNLLEFVPISENMSIITA